MSTTFEPDVPPPDQIELGRNDCPPFIEIKPGKGGKRQLRFNFHAGHHQAWASNKRIVALIAGARSGKTSFGPPWIYREMRARGPGDYLVVGPSFQILEKAAAPELQYLFESILKLGKMRYNPLQFVFSAEGCRRLWGAVLPRKPRIMFGHADKPNTLEALTGKAAWLDECGQPEFKLGSYEAILRRLSVDRGRMLLTTTPYEFGTFLKTKIWDPWETAQLNGEDHPLIDVFSFDSLMNPAFPKEEYERNRQELPKWKFDLFFRGIFTRPTGLIYDVFQKHHIVDPFTPEAHWPRFLGLDFGAINTAGVWLAQSPFDRNYYAYEEYHAGCTRTAGGHVEEMRKIEPRPLRKVVGGSKSESQWRIEWADAGMHVSQPAIVGVELGIMRIYAMLKKNNLYICRHLEKTISQFETYSYELDDVGEPTDEIDDKATYHMLDAIRYIGSRLAPTKEKTGKGPRVFSPGMRTNLAPMPRFGGR